MKKSTLLAALASILLLAGCGDDNDKPAQCTPGCTNNTQTICNTDGTSQQITCFKGCNEITHQCNQEICTDMCTSDGKLLKCTANGSTEVIDCVNGCDSSQKKCYNPSGCTSDICSDNNLVKCNINGTVTVEPCPAGCDSNTNTCIDPDSKCKESVCSGSNLIQCNPDGSTSVVPCPNGCNKQKKTCNDAPASCSANVCANNTLIPCIGGAPQNPVNCPNGCNDEGDNCKTSQNPTCSANVCANDTLIPCIGGAPQNPVNCPNGCNDEGNGCRQNQNPTCTANVCANNTLIPCIGGEPQNPVNCPNGCNDEGNGCRQNQNPTCTANVCANDTLIPCIGGAPQNPVNCPNGCNDEGNGCRQNQNPTCTANVCANNTLIPCIGGAPQNPVNCPNGCNDEGNGCRQNQNPACSDDVCDGNDLLECDLTSGQTTRIHCAYGCNDATNTCHSIASMVCTENFCNDNALIECNPSTGRVKAVIPCANGCDQIRHQCVPEEQSCTEDVCDGDYLVQCNRSTGKTKSIYCDYGCNADELRCKTRTEDIPLSGPCDPATYPGLCSDDLSIAYYCSPQESIVISNTCSSGNICQINGLNQAYCSQPNAQLVTTGGTPNVDRCDPSEYIPSCINDNANALVCIGGKVKRWNCEADICFLDSSSSSGVFCSNPGHCSHGTTYCQDINFLGLSYSLVDNYICRDGHLVSDPYYEMELCEASCDESMTKCSPVTYTKCSQESLDSCASVYGPNYTCYAINGIDKYCAMTCNPSLTTTMNFCEENDGESAIYSGTCIPFAGSTTQGFLSADGIVDNCLNQCSNTLIDQCDEYGTSAKCSSHTCTSDGKNVLKCVDGYTQLESCGSDGFCSALTNSSYHGVSACAYNADYTTTPIDSKKYVCEKIVDTDGSTLYYYVEKQVLKSSNGSKYWVGVDMQQCAGACDDSRGCLPISNLEGQYCGDEYARCDGSAVLTCEDNFWTAYLDCATNMGENSTCIETDGFYCMEKCDREYDTKIKCIVDSENEYGGDYYAEYTCVKDPNSNTLYWEISEDYYFCPTYKCENDHACQKQFTGEGDTCGNSYTEKCINGFATFCEDGIIAGSKCTAECITFQSKNRAACVTTDDECNNLNQESTVCYDSADHLSSHEAPATCLAANDGKSYHYIDYDHNKTCQQYCNDDYTKCDDSGYNP